MSAFKVPEGGKLSRREALQYLALIQVLRQNRNYKAEKASFKDTAKKATVKKGWGHYSYFGAQSIKK